jgi:DNA topoisomerase-1
MAAFSEALPRIRKQVDADLSQPGLSRDKVLATIVRLLECSCIRVGNEEYARANDSCQSIPGEDLFQYLDDDGERQTVGSGDVNDYIRRAAGDDFTAKDFRTWAGTILAVEALSSAGAFDSEREGKSKLLGAIDRVADQLNNTRAVCRKYYVHPAVMDSYLDGTMVTELTPSRNGTRPGALTRMELAVVELIRRRPANGNGPKR